ncbi:probable E3 ubiquitin-protein ligase DTX3 isoform X2 [Heterodontus francisci]|uniref:probable E3 ubiquitin-protein ligase DTX3 isoform X2 n=1 Tax=Heterodontus francisci TaxID=7792 RepID=UPI00355C2F61
MTARWSRVAGDKHPNSSRSLRGTVGGKRVRGGSGGGVVSSHSHRLKTLCLVLLVSHTKEPGVRRHRGNLGNNTHNKAPTQQHGARWVRAGRSVGTPGQLGHADCGPPTARVQEEARGGAAGPGGATRQGPAFCTAGPPAGRPVPSGGAGQGRLRPSLQRGGAGRRRWTRPRPPRRRRRPRPPRDPCPICLCEVADPKILGRCQHAFCRPCIEEAFKTRPACPVCGHIYGIVVGNQPLNGTMSFVRDKTLHLPGYENSGAISITYSIPSGTQGPEHPNPGLPYQGTTRRAYLPDCKEGQKVHRLLRKAFDQRLTFTVGTSRTTGKANVVTWNDIHHKTSPWGGPEL